MTQKEPVLSRDDKGNLLIRGNCSVCKKCWIYLSKGPAQGSCIYGGPFEGYHKMPDGEGGAAERGVGVLGDQKETKVPLPKRPEGNHWFIRFNTRDRKFEYVNQKTGKTAP